MRRNGLLVGGWALATLFALVLGLQGIHSVSTSVTNPRPAPLSPASVKAALQRTNAAASSSASAASASSASGTPDDRSTSSTSASSGVTDDRGSIDESTTFSVGPVPAPASGRDAQTGASSAPQSSSTSSQDTRSSDRSGDTQSSSSSAATTTTTAPAQDKTYQLVGGSVGVRFENGGAYLLWAQPNTGYSVDTNNSGGEVEVRFDNGEHESRLHAWWDNGPQQEIEERSSGD